MKRQKKFFFPDKGLDEPLDEILSYVTSPDFCKTPWACVTISVGKIGPKNKKGIVHVQRTSLKNENNFLIKFHRCKKKVCDHNICQKPCTSPLKNESFVNEEIPPKKKREHGKRSKSSSVINLVGPKGEMCISLADSMKYTPIFQTETDSPLGEVRISGEKVRKSKAVNPQRPSCILYVYGDESKRKLSFQLHPDMELFLSRALDKIENYVGTTQVTGGAPEKKVEERGDFSDDSQVNVSKKLDYPRTASQKCLKSTGDPSKCPKKKSAESQKSPKSLVKMPPPKSVNVLDSSTSSSNEDILPPKKKESKVIRPSRKSDKLPLKSGRTYTITESESENSSSSVLSKKSKQQDKGKRKSEKTQDKKSRGSRHSPIVLSDSNLSSEEDTTKHPQRITEVKKQSRRRSKSLRSKRSQTSAGDVEASDYTSEEKLVSQKQKESRSSGKMTTIGPYVISDSEYSISSVEEDTVSRKITKKSQSDPKNKGKVSESPKRESELLKKSKKNSGSPRAIDSRESQKTPPRDSRKQPTRASRNAGNQFEKESYLPGSRPSVRKKSSVEKTQTYYKTVDKRDSDSVIKTEKRKSKKTVQYSEESDSSDDTEIFVETNNLKKYVSRTSSSNLPSLKCKCTCDNNSCPKIKRAKKTRNVGTFLGGPIDKLDGDNTDSNPKRHSKTTITAPERKSGNDKTDTQKSPGKKSSSTQVPNSEKDEKPTGKENAPTPDNKELPKETIVNYYPCCCCGCERLEPITLNVGEPAQQSQLLLATSERNQQRNNNRNKDKSRMENNNSAQINRLSSFTTIEVPQDSIQNHSQFERVSGRHFSKQGEGNLSRATGKPSGRPGNSDYSHQHQDKWPMEDPRRTHRNTRRNDNSETQVYFALNDLNVGKTELISGNKRVSTHELAHKYSTVNERICPHVAQRRILHSSQMDTRFKDCHTTFVQGSASSHDRRTSQNSTMFVVPNRKTQYFVTEPNCGSPFRVDSLGAVGLQPMIHNQNNEYFRRHPSFKKTKHILNQPNENMNFSQLVIEREQPVMISTQTVPSDFEPRDKYRIMSTQCTQPIVVCQNSTNHFQPNRVRSHSPTRFNQMIGLNRPEQACERKGLGEKTMPNNYPNACTGSASEYSNSQEGTPVNPILQTMAVRSPGNKAMKSDQSELRVFPKESYEKHVNDGTQCTLDSCPSPSESESQHRSGKRRRLLSDSSKFFVSPNNSVPSPQLAGSSDLFRTVCTSSGSMMHFQNTYKQHRQQTGTMTSFSNASIETDRSPNEKRHHFSQQPQSYQTMFLQTCDGAPSHPSTKETSSGRNKESSMAKDRNQQTGRKQERPKGCCIPPANFCFNYLRDGSDIYQANYSRSNSIPTAIKEMCDLEYFVPPRETPYIGFVQNEFNSPFQTRPLVECNTCDISGDEKTEVLYSKTHKDTNSQESKESTPSKKHRHEFSGTQKSTCTISKESSMSSGSDHSLKSLSNESTSQGSRNSKDNAVFEDEELDVNHYSTMANDCSAIRNSINKNENRIELDQSNRHDPRLNGTLALVEISREKTSSYNILEDESVSFSDGSSIASCKDSFKSRKTRNGRLPNDSKRLKDTEGHLLPEILSSSSDLSSERSIDESVFSVNFTYDGKRISTTRNDNESNKTSCNSNRMQMKCLKENTSKTTKSEIKSKTSKSNNSYDKRPINNCKRI